MASPQRPAPCRPHPDSALAHVPNTKRNSSRNSARELPELIIRGKSMARTSDSACSTPQISGPTPLLEQRSAADFGLARTSLGLSCDQRQHFPEMPIAFPTAVKHQGPQPHQRVAGFQASVQARTVLRLGHHEGVGLRDVTTADGAALPTSHPIVEAIGRAGLEPRLSAVVPISSVLASRASRAVSGRCIHQRRRGARISPGFVRANKIFGRFPKSLRVPKSLRDCAG